MFTQVQHVLSVENMSQSMNVPSVPVHASQHYDHFYQPQIKYECIQNLVDPMAYVSAQLNIRRLEYEPLYALLSRFLEVIQNIPMSFMLQDSKWIDLFLQVYEPSDVHWSKDLKPTNMIQIIEWIYRIKGFKSKIALDVENYNIDNEKVEQKCDNNAQVSSDASCVVEDEVHCQLAVDSAYEQHVDEECMSKNDCHDNLNVN